MRRGPPGASAPVPGCLYPARSPPGLFNPRLQVPASATRTTQSRRQPARRFGHRRAQQDSAARLASRQRRPPVTEHLRHSPASNIVHFRSLNSRALASAEHWPLPARVLPRLRAALAPAAGKLAPCGGCHRAGDGGGLVAPKFLVTPGAYWVLAQQAMQPPPSCRQPLESSSGPLGGGAAVVG